MVWTELRVGFRVEDPRLPHPRNIMSDNAISWKRPVWDRSRPKSVPRETAEQGRWQRHLTAGMAGLIVVTQELFRVYFRVWAKGFHAGQTNHLGSAWYASGH